MIASCCVGLFCGDPSRCFPTVDPWDNIEFRRENGKRERNKNRKQKQENGEDLMFPDDCRKRVETTRFKQTRILPV